MRTVISLFSIKIPVSLSLCQVGVHVKLQAKIKIYERKHHVRKIKITFSVSLRIIASTAAASDDDLYVASRVRIATAVSIFTDERSPWSSCSSHVSHAQRKSRIGQVFPPVVLAETLVYKPIYLSLQN